MVAPVGLERWFASLGDASRLPLGTTLNAVSVQILWSLSVAVVDIYTLLVRRSLRKLIILRLFAIGAVLI